jgi:hypothetical protein
MGCGISTVSPRLKLSRSRIVIIPRREARRGYLPGQTTRLDCSGTAKTSIHHTRHLVLQFVLAETFLSLQARDMVEVKVKEKVGNGKLLSFLAFELLSGVFK